MYHEIMWTKLHGTFPGWGVPQEIAGGTRTIGWELLIYLVL